MRTHYEFCAVSIEDRVLLVAINRPEVRNALHSAAHDELEQIWNEYAAEDGLWVAILTGTGAKAFSAGHDLKSHAAAGAVRFAQGGTGFGGLTERADLTKPIIAAVNGAALGGGFEIVLACDLVIAADTASFALPEPRVGLAALAGGAHRLAQQIPFKSALGIILTGRTVGAHEALRLGIVNDVVPDADLMSAARRWAQLVLECSPLSVRASKQAAYASLGAGDFNRRASMELPAVKALFTSDDFDEGPRAFVEKRAPRWRGR